MADEQIIADYSLDTMLDDNSQRAGIEQIISKYRAYDEERERKRRERLYKAQQQAVANANVARNNSSSGGFDEQDTAIADGLSLALGSEAHENYVQNRQGMDQFERQRADLASIGFGTKGDQQAPGADEFHDERYEVLSQQDAVTSDDNELQLDRGEFGVSAKLESHVIKHVQAEKIMRMASAKAGGTNTDIDDNFVEKVLPHILDERTHDAGIHDLEKDIAITGSILDNIAKNEAQAETEVEFSM